MYNQSTKVDALHCQKFEHNFARNARYCQNFWSDISDWKSKL